MHTTDFTAQDGLKNVKADVQHNLLKRLLFTTFSKSFDSVMDIGVNISSILSVPGRVSE